MSPECGRNEPYNHKTDVYSFGLLCYEILTLERPLVGIIPGGNDFKKNEKVAKELIWIPNGIRPNLEDGWVRWPQPLSTRLQRCWDDDISLRPAMKEAQYVLKETLPLLWRHDLSRQLKQALLRKAPTTTFKTL